MLQQQKSGKANGYIHRMEYNPAIKSNELWIHTTKINLKNIMRERSPYKRLHALRCHPYKRSRAGNADMYGGLHPMQITRVNYV